MGDGNNRRRRPHERLVTHENDDPRRVHFAATPSASPTSSRWPTTASRRSCSLSSMMGLLCGILLAITLLAALVGRAVKISRPVDQLSPSVKAYIERAIIRSLRDPVGRRDFALYADGGRVVAELTKISSSHGMIAPSSTNSPVAAITDEMHIGHCWLFSGNAAQLGLKLSEMIYPTHISIDHIPHEIAADIGRAPRSMVLWGSVDGSLNESHLHNLTHSLPSTFPKLHGRSAPKVTGPRQTYIPLVSFEYDIRAPSSVQTFSLEETILESDLYSGVYVLEILDNWGSDSTCLYRVRIHGQRRVQ